MLYYEIYGHTCSQNCECAITRYMVLVSKLILLKVHESLIATIYYGEPNAKVYHGKFDHESSAHQNLPATTTAIQL